MASQYTEQYLDRTAVSPVTPGTFLAQHLRGKAKQYSGHYYSALMRDLKQREEAGAVKAVPSVLGGVAWVRVT